MKKKLALLGLLLTLTVAALATPSTPAYAWNTCDEECLNYFEDCEANCYVEFPPSQNLAAYQACDTACRHDYGVCRRSC